MARPLAGIRVLDLSERSPAAANAGMILSDFGAEVIRVEPEGGDSLRALPGSRVWLRGQKSVTIGPEQIRDGSWEALRASADVILDTAQPWTQKPSGLLDGWGKDPRQILCVLTAVPSAVDEGIGPGRRGEMPVYGELIEARYGLMDAQDGYRDGPIFLGWPHVTYGAAWLLEIGILGALFERGQTGRGQVVTTSLLDGAAVLSTHHWLAGDNVQEPPHRSARQKGMTGLFQCGDGRWIQAHTGPRGAFGRLMNILGREDMAKADNRAIRGMPPEAVDELWQHAVKTYNSQPAQHWIDLLNKHDICCMPALPPGDALWLDQMAANGMVDVSPEGRQLGVPAKYSRTPVAAGRGVPAPGQHNAVLLKQRQQKLSVSASRVHESVGQRTGPLNGVLVLDLGFFLAGPFGPRTLADLGARVIKVEEVGGHSSRPTGLPLNGGWLGVQRGKECISLDLKTGEGREVLYELVKKADVVHHNIRKHALPRLGIDYETLKNVNPNIIYCHSSGYGNDGPWAPFPTLEPLHSAITGMLIRTGGQGNPPNHYFSNMDYGCGLTSTVAVLAALIERQESGQGQYVEVPQTAAGLVAMSDVHYQGDQKSETFALDSEQRGHAPTNGLYQTQDGWIVVSCYSDQDWHGVARALNIPAASWPTYAQARQQPMNGDAAKALQRKLAAITGAEAERRFGATGVPCAIPMAITPAQAVADPLMRKHEVILTEIHPEAGEITEVAYTIRFGTRTKPHTRPAPTLGQDTVRILREIGKSDAEIQELIAAKVVDAATQVAAR